MLCSPPFLGVVRGHHLHWAQQMLHSPPLSGLDMVGFLGHWAQQIFFSLPVLGHTEDTEAAAGDGVQVMLVLSASCNDISCVISLCVFVSSRLSLESRDVLKKCIYINHTSKSALGWLSVYSMSC